MPVRVFTSSTIASTSASVKRRDKTLGRSPGDGVDLHQLDLPAGGDDLVQPIAKGIQLVGDGGSPSTRMKSD